MPLELEVLLKNFLVAGLAHGILCLLGGQSIQQIHPTKFLGQFFINNLRVSETENHSWLITSEIVGSTPTSATIQNGWGFSKRRILIRFVKWGQHPYQLPFQFFNKTICGVEQPGLARLAHNQEVTGSNPVPATIQWPQDVRCMGRLIISIIARLAFWAVRFCMRLPF